MHELIQEWRAWQASGAQGVLPGDEALLDRLDLITDIRSWAGFVESKAWVTKSKRLHLGLTPTPFVGSLELALRTGMSLVDAFALTRRNLAVIELVPYHSAQFGLPGSVMRELRSVRLAREYVREAVLPRVARGDATVLVTRKAKLWGVEPSDRAIVYGASEARGAHMGPDTRGGKAVLCALLEASGGDRQ